MIDDLRTRIAAVEPAIRTDFGQLLEDDIGDLTGGVPQPIDVKVFGEDQATLQETARRIAAIASRVRGVEDVFDGITIAGPALRLETRPLELARRGLTTDDLQREVEAATVGSVAGDRPHRRAGLRRPRLHPPRRRPGRASPSAAGTASRSR